MKLTSQRFSERWGHDLFEDGVGILDVDIPLGLEPSCDQVVECGRHGLESVLELVAPNGLLERGIEREGDLDAAKEFSAHDFEWNLRVKYR